MELIANFTSRSPTESWQPMQLKNSAPSRRQGLCNTSIMNHAYIHTTSSSRQNIQNLFDTLTSPLGFRLIQPTFCKSIPDHTSNLFLLQIDSTKFCKFLITDCMCGDLWWRWKDNGSESTDNICDKQTCRHELSWILTSVRWTGPSVHFVPIPSLHMDNKKFCTAQHVDLKSSRCWIFPSGPELGGARA